MDNIQTSEVSTASVDTAASPALVADSSVSVDANQSVQAAQPEQNMVQQPAQDANAGVASDDQFPDDAAFERLPGEQRSTHWQNARNHIAELKQQLAERDAQLQSFQELANPSNDYLRPDLLFAPVMENGQPKLDEYGDPVTSPAPFLEQLRNESPQTFGQMVWEAMQQPWTADESTARVLLRDYYGLNPELIETYRQIQNPEDAQSFIPQPADMSHIPQQYHDLYKSLDWETRDQIDAVMDDAARNLMLRGLNAEFQVKQEAQKREQAIQQERQRAFQAEVQQFQVEVRNGIEATLKQQLEKQVQLTGDAQTDGLLMKMFFGYAAEALAQDPAALPIIEKLNAYTGNLEKHQARQHQALVVSHAARVLKEPIAKLSEIFSAARKYQDLQRQNAVPRTEIGQRGGQGELSPVNGNNGLQQRNHSRSLFNEAEIAQLAAQVRAAQGG